MSFFKRIIGSTSYKEIQAWVFSIINLAILSIYGSEVWAHIGSLDGNGLPAFAGLILVSICTTVFTVYLIVPTAILFHRTANERADERDRLIYMEGRALAFWTLSILVSLSLIAYVVHQIGDLLFHTVLMSILAAQLVYAFSTAVKYRKAGVSLLSDLQD